MKGGPIKNRKLHHVPLRVVACSLAAIHAACNAWADPPSQSPPPIPTPPPGVDFISLQARVQPHRVATITLSSDQSVVLTRAAASKFQLVAARPGETALIVIPMPVTALRPYAAVQALDGGKLIETSPVRIQKTINTSPVPINGTVTVHFQVGTQPGLYRVLFLGLGPAATIQFWVQDPQRPETNPWTVNASHWQTQ